MAHQPIRQLAAAVFGGLIATRNAPFWHGSAGLLFSAIPHIDAGGDLLQQLRKELLLYSGMRRVIPRIAHLQRVTFTVDEFAPLLIQIICQAPLWREYAAHTQRGEVIIVFNQSNRRARQVGAA